MKKNSITVASGTACVTSNNNNNTTKKTKKIGKEERSKRRKQRKEKKRNNEEEEEVHTTPKERVKSKRGRMAERHRDELHLKEAKWRRHTENVKRENWHSSRQ